MHRTGHLHPIDRPASHRHSNPHGHLQRLQQSRRCLSMEYLVSMTTHVPDGTPEEAVQDIRAREAAHSRELAAQGHLLRLWRPPLQPGDGRALGLWQARDAAQMQEILEALPLAPWMTMDTTPLSPHPSDPAIIHPPATAPTGTP